jgi:hypothetical protein
MAIPLHKAVSSLESIQSSVETDRQVYRWFLMLISVPTVKARLSGTPANRELYQRLRVIALGEIACYAAGVIVLASALNLKQPALLLAGIVLLYMLQKLYAANRRTTAQLSANLLTADFSGPSLGNQTLFQICEYYGRALDIPSLVDTITRQDAIARNTLIYANIFACFIYPMNFWSIWILILSSFYLVSAAVHTSVIFNKLK